MDTVILSNASTDEFVECSRRHVKTTGKLFKKQIFSWGAFSHPQNPNMKINVDRAFYDALKRNFDNGECPIVQVPLADAQNRHSEAPDANIGEVVDITAEEKGVYAYIDVRKHMDDVGKTILGASAKMSLDYTNNKTNTRVGPTLLHVAATNRPFLTDLDDFEIVSASDADTSEEVVLLTDGVNTEPDSPQEETIMTKDEMLASLSADYGIDVEAGLQAQQRVEGFVALSSVVGVDDINPENLSQVIVDLTNSVSDRDTQIAQLTETLQTVQLTNAEAEVDALITQARILPAWRDDMIELSVSNRTRFETFLLPEAVAQVELNEAGFTSTESTHEEDPAAAAQAEGVRLAKLTK